MEDEGPPMLGITWTGTWGIGWDGASSRMGHGDHLGWAMKVPAGWGLEDLLDPDSSS